MFYVYILYSPNFDKYYIGHSDDPFRRLEEHNHLSESGYTSKYRPWLMAVSFSVGPDRGLARKVENHLKKQKSKQYLKQIIQRNSIDQIIERCKTVG